MKLGVDMKHIMFARYGGLSPKRNKKKEQWFFKEDDPIRFHTPPVKKGMYAFIWPYIDLFLVGWDKNKQRKRKKVILNGYGDPLPNKMEPIRKFEHHGELWCHFVDEALRFGVAKEVVNTWVKIDTDDLPILLKEVMKTDKKRLRRDPYLSNEVIKNPYKRGQNGWMSKDHLEVFISGKIRESKRNGKEY